MSRRSLAGGLVAGAAVVAAVTLAARVLGFGRWLAFSGTVGAQCVGGAYQTANQLPNVLFEVVAGGALVGAVVPLLAGPLARAAADEVDRIASALLTWALTVLLPAALLLALLAGPVARAMLDDEKCAGQHALAARMLVVFAPQVVLYGVGVVLTGVLQAHRRFFWPAFAPLVSSAVVITSYLVFAAVADGAQDRGAQALPGGAEAVLAWGTTAGVAALTLPLLVPVARTGVRLRPRWRFPAGVARRAAALAGAGLVALLAQQVSVLVVVRSANAFGDAGAINVFTYAQAVYLLPYAVLAVPLATVAFPRLAEAAATRDRVAFGDTAARTTRAVLLVALLGAAALAGTAPAVGEFFVVLERGDASALAPTLAAMAPGLVGFAVIAHVGRALYSLERSRAAAGATAAGWLVVALAAFALARAAATPSTAVVALGVASSAGMTVAGLLLLLALRRAAGPAALAGVARTLAVGLLAAAAGLLAARLVTDAVLQVSGGGAVGAVAAGLLGALAAVAALGAGVTVGDRDTAREATALGRRRRRS